MLFLSESFLGRYPQFGNFESKLKLPLRTFNSSFPTSTAKITAVISEGKNGLTKKFSPEFEILIYLLEGANILCLSTLNVAMSGIPNYICEGQSRYRRGSKNSKVV